MLLLQSGVPKSGNYWLYRILQQSLRRSGVPQRSYVQAHPIYQEALTWPNFADQAAIDYLEVEPEGCYFRKGAYREQIPDLDAYLRACSHVWTHAPWSDRLGQVFSRFDKIVYIIRHPGDIAVSASRYKFTPFVQEQHPHGEPDPEAYLDHRLYELALNWVRHVGGYLLHAEEYGIHIVFYERLLAGFDSELDSLLGYLGLPLPQTERDAIQEAVSFSAMKSRSPDHVRSGRMGGWRDAIDPEEQKRLLGIVSPMLEILGYSPDGSGLPGFERIPDPEGVRNAMRLGRGGLGEKVRYAAAYARSKRPLSEKVRKGFGFLFGRGWR